VHYRVITAFFPQRNQAEHAIAELSSIGVATDSMSLLPRHIGHRDDLALHARTKAAEGAALGGLLGGAVGAFAGALAAGGSLVAPVLGMVVAGPAVAALAAAGALGALGTVVGALLGARVPGYEARYLDDALAASGALLAVRCLGDGWMTIERVLSESGARRVRFERG
jgi:hypothetical protein